MWYEVLPSVALIGTLITIPNIFIYFSNKLFLGQPFRRCVEREEVSYYYLRDARISGRNWAYDFKGLDNIPNDEVVVEKSDSSGVSSGKKHCD